MARGLVSRGFREYKEREGAAPGGEQNNENLNALMEIGHFQ